MISSFWRTSSGLQMQNAPSYHTWHTCSVNIYSKPPFKRAFPRRHSHSAEHLSCRGAYSGNGKIDQVVSFVNAQSSTRVNCSPSRYQVRGAGEYAVLVLTSWVSRYPVQYTGQKRSWQISVLHEGPSYLFIQTFIEHLLYARYRGFGDT